MPDLLLHLIVPLVALLLLYDRRYWMYVLLLCPLAILPDIDHLAAGDFAARMWLHNIFVLLPPLLVGVYAYKTGHKKAYTVAFIALFYLSCHILLDLFQGGVSLFYPITDANFAVTVDLLKQFQSITPHVAFNVSAPQRDPSAVQDVVSSVSVAVAAIFIVIGVVRELLGRKS